VKSSRFIPKPKLVDKNAFVLDCAKGKYVLHIGMGGHLEDSSVVDAYLKTDLTQSLQGQLARVASRVDGIDINVRPLEAMKKAVPGFYAFCDVCSPDFGSILGDRRYQLIVFGDTVEHLDDCRSALRNLRSVLADDGVLLVSTVNAYSFDAMVKLLFGYESVHEEHTAYYSYSTLHRLFAMNGLEMGDFKYYTHMRLKKFDSLTHRITYHLSSLIVRLLPQYAMGVLALARPAAARAPEAVDAVAAPMELQSKVGS
jgi:2-polyprenyl-3-methyl-5-hydroxy-6-metoxy-1,4-benzoquinol methylase